MAIELEKELSPRENEAAEGVLATRAVILVEVGERRHAPDYMACRSEGSASTPAVKSTVPPVIAIRNALLSGPDLPGAYEHLRIAEYGDKRMVAGPIVDRLAAAPRERPRCHIAAILRDSGYSASEIAALRRDRVYLTAYPKRNVRRGHRGGDQPWRALKRGLVLLMT